MSDRREGKDQGKIVTAAILVVGDEILSGRTKDKNIGYIAEYLTTIGIDLKEVRVVPDDQPEIVAAVNALRNRYTYVFTTGGIGPTPRRHHRRRGRQGLRCRARLSSAGGRNSARAPRADRRGDERSAHAHDPHAGRRRTGAQQDLGGARFSYRQCHRHGRHPERDAGDARMGDAATENRRQDAFGKRAGRSARGRYRHRARGDRQSPSAT